MKCKPNGVFVTGTGTDVGKTFVSSLIAANLYRRKFELGIYKPVSSGCVMRDGELVSEDARSLWLAAGQPGSLHDVSPQRFELAVAPNVAARSVGEQVDARRLRDGFTVWADAKLILVEGVGGLMSPISDEDLVADLAADFCLPLIVVVANRLGCINDTLQTLVAAQHYGLTVNGIVLNDVVGEVADSSTESNLQEIGRLSDVQPIIRVRHGSKEISDSTVNELLRLPE